MWVLSMESSHDQWMEGLSPCGLYYEGYTDDLQQMLTKHSSATVTTYGVRRSHINNHVVKIAENDKENCDENGTGKDIKYNIVQT